MPEACDSIIKVKSEQTHNAHNHQVYQAITNYITSCITLLKKILRHWPNCEIPDKKIPLQSVTNCIPHCTPVEIPTRNGAIEFESN